MQPSKPKPVSATTRPVVPWNKGAFVGPKPPLKPKQVWSIRLTLQREGRIRDLPLFDLAVDSKLRGCDLVHAAHGEWSLDFLDKLPVPDHPAGGRHRTS